MLSGCLPPYSSVTSLHHVPASRPCVTSLCHVPVSRPCVTSLRHVARLLHLLSQAAAVTPDGRFGSPLRYV